MRTDCCQATSPLGTPSIEYPTAWDYGTVANPWLSNYELLHFRPDGNVPYRYDLQSKANVRLGELENQVTAAAQAKTYSLSVSPDGQWVLGYGMEGGVFAASMDGKVVRSWRGTDLCPAPEGEDNYTGECWWFADSRHWFAINDNPAKGPDAFIGDMCSVSSPGSVESFPAPNLSIIGVLADETVISNEVGMVDWMHSRGDKFPQTYSQWNLHKLAPLHTWPVMLPNIPDPFSAEASQQGDHIAWLVGDDENMLAVNLWISNIDGSHLREISGLRKTEDLQHNIADTPDSLNWSPDGTQISYIFHGGLWVVPA